MEDLATLQRLWDEQLKIVDDLHNQLVKERETLRKLGQKLSDIEFSGLDMGDDK